MDASVLVEKIEERHRAIELRTEVVPTNTDANPSVFTPFATGLRFLGSVDGVAKRVLDILIAFTILIVASPALLAIAVLISLDGGSILYRHQRVGKDLRPFNCLKFRSMMPGAQEILEEYLFFNPADAQTWRRERKLAFDPRVTAIGRLLRRTSLDELPQLLNVLRGEMSLVGPRPITAPEMDNYGPMIGFYASVKPGITGLWQVSGRSDIGYEARVALDRCYASIHNVVMDAAILIYTPVAVISGRGAR